MTEPLNSKPLSQNPPTPHRTLDPNPKLSTLSTLSPQRYILNPKSHLNPLNHVTSLLRRSRLRVTSSRSLCLGRSLAWPHGVRQVCSDKFGPLGFLCLSSKLWAPLEYRLYHGTCYSGVPKWDSIGNYPLGFAVSATHIYAQVPFRSPKPKTQIRELQTP